MSALPLDADQTAHFTQNGYIFIPGLIPPAMIDAAAQALWGAMSLSPDDPTDWPGTITAQRSDNPDLSLCFTPRLRTIAAQLIDADPALLTPPDVAFAIISFPLKVKGRWKWPKPHIDNGAKTRPRKIQPPPHRLVTLIYLNDVERQGGGTVIWPGTHRQLQSLVDQNPASYTYLWQLNEQLDQFALGDPMELTPRRGDVLFYHRLLVHAGSANTTPRPRLALHEKW